MTASLHYSSQYTHFNIQYIVTYTKRRRDFPTLCSINMRGRQAGSEGFFFLHYNDKKVIDGTRASTLSYPPLCALESVARTRDYETDTDRLPEHFPLVALFPCCIHKEGVQVSSMYCPAHVTLSFSSSVLSCARFPFRRELLQAEAEYLSALSSRHLTSPSA